MSPLIDSEMYVKISLASSYSLFELPLKAALNKSLYTWGRPTNGWNFGIDWTDGSAQGQVLPDRYSWKKPEGHAYIKLHLRVQRDVTDRMASAAW